MNYSEMVTRFPDPFHIGTHASLAIALVSDGICSVHAVLGLATRWSALIISANVFVAWATVVHFQFFGRGVTPGESIFLYIGSFLAATGRFSLDYRISILLKRRRRMGSPAARSVRLPTRHD